MEPDQHPGAGTAKIGRRGETPVVAVRISLQDAEQIDLVEWGARVPAGVAPNELTKRADRDPWAVTMRHESLPARLEPVRRSVRA